VHLDNGERCSRRALEGQARQHGTQSLCPPAHGFPGWPVCRMGGPRAYSQRSCQGQCVSWALVHQEMEEFEDIEGSSQPSFRVQAQAASQTLGYNEIGPPQLKSDSPIAPPEREAWRFRSKLAVVR
jgi:hypothetical protein